MTLLRVLASRVLALFTSRRDDAALRDEIQGHLDLLAGEYARRGLSPEEARDAARREFGGVDQIKETYRDRQRLPFVETTLQDLRYAVRTFRRSLAS